MLSGGGSLGRAASQRKSTSSDRSWRPVLEHVAADPLGRGFEFRHEVLELVDVVEVFRRRVRHLEQGQEHVVDHGQLAGRLAAHEIVDRHLGRQPVVLGEVQELRQPRLEHRHDLFVDRAVGKPLLHVGQQRRLRGGGRLERAAACARVRATVVTAQQALEVRRRPAGRRARGSPRRGARRRRPASAAGCRSPCVTTTRGLASASAPERPATAPRRRAPRAATPS